MKLDKVKGGCIYCSKKTNEFVCSDCLYWQQYSKTKMFKVSNYSLYYYNDYAKDIIRELKFLGNVQILLAFKQEIKLFFRKHFHKTYYLVPTPLHDDRLNERGFNQSLYLARLISCPILDIVKKRKNDKQSKKTKQDRILFDDNFYIDKKENLFNKSVMIVDDIYTTGATIHKIAKLLYELGAKEIVSFTLFRS